MLEVCVTVDSEWSDPPRYHIVVALFMLFDAVTECECFIVTVRYKQTFCIVCCRCESTQISARDSTSRYIYVVMARLNSAASAEVV